MKGLKAVLWKDWKLFRTGAGLVSLVLPLLLLCLLRLGMGDSLRQAYVQPFPIAVRDLDQTVMSRTLVNQIGQVDLFSQVIPVEKETDGELLQRGCAAVLTIPKDFFYTMYSMDNGLVEVSLNDAMPLEASLLHAMFVSVMDIISTDQAVGRAVFRFCYGDLDSQTTAQLWEDTSQQIIRDALGRQQVFTQTGEASALQSDLELRLLACALSLICLFFPLSAVKTLPQELSSGILPRYLASGGRAPVFFLSKFLSSILLALPSLGLILLVFPQKRPWMLLLAFLTLYLFGFSLLLCLSAWAKDAADAQRWGNLLLLLSLILGGILYPAQLLPGFAQQVGTLTLPHWALRALGLLSTVRSPLQLLTGLWPVWDASAALFLLAVPGLRRNKGSSFPLPQPREAVQPPAPSSGKVFPFLPLSLQKLKAMSGGVATFTCLLLTAALCGALAASSLREPPDTLTLGVVLSDSDPYAAQLCDRLSAQPGLEVLQTDPEAGDDLLSSGRIEGLLTVETGYGTALAGQGALPLRYRNAPGASSGTATREIIAGQASAQRAILRGLADAEKRLGRFLSSGERSSLLAQIETEEAASAPLYAVTGLPGTGTPESLLIPGQFSLALFVMLLTALTWCTWAGTPDARRVEHRLFSLPGGPALSYASDALALLLAVLAAGACSLLWGGTPLRDWLILPAYGLCVAGLALTLARWGAAGRMDALAPFITLLTCLVGGCFGDISLLSPALSALSLLTPQGLALRWSAGAAFPMSLLTVLGLVFLLLGAPRPHPE